MTQLGLLPPFFAFFTGLIASDYADIAIVPELAAHLLSLRSNLMNLDSIYFVVGLHPGASRHANHRVRCSFLMSKNPLDSEKA